MNFQTTAGLVIAGIAGAIFICIFFATWKHCLDRQKPPTPRSPRKSPSRRSVKEPKMEFMGPPPGHRVKKESPRSVGRRTSDALGQSMSSIGGEAVDLVENSMSSTMEGARKVVPPTDFGSSNEPLLQREPTTDTLDTSMTHTRKDSLA
eukprot:Hpha_TRINITY_DN7040_c0_g2::TRINITY_DN7040_c0_g2_i1::g.22837::m.22837